MNRRNFILTGVALLAAGPCTSVALAVPNLNLSQRTLVLTRRLGPLSRKVTCTGSAIADIKGQLVLRALNNGLWIEQVSWLDDNGTLHQIPVHRNAPRNMQFALPAMARARRIEIGLACLPLATQQTVIELTMEGPATAM